MQFNTKQDSHEQLRALLRERTDSVVAWVGSGASKAAELPTWPELKEKLIAAVKNKADTLDERGSVQLHGKAEAAIKLNNYWRALEILKDALGLTSWREIIKKNPRDSSSSTDTTDISITLEDWRSSDSHH